MIPYRMSELVPGSSLCRVPSGGMLLAFSFLSGILAFSASAPPTSTSLRRKLNRLSLCGAHLSFFVNVSTEAPSGLVSSRQTISPSLEISLCTCGCLNGFAYSVFLLVLGELCAVSPGLESAESSSSSSRTGLAKLGWLAHARCYALRCC